MRSGRNPCSVLGTSPLCFPNQRLHQEPREQSTQRQAPLQASFSPDKTAEPLSSDLQRVSHAGTTVDYWGRQEEGGAGRKKGAQADCAARSSTDQQHAGALS